MDMTAEQMDVGMLSQMRLELKAARQALEMIGDEAPQEAYEQVAEMEQAVEAMEAEQRRRLDALALYLSGEHERCIKARANVDNRMWADERQYEGKTRLAEPNKRYPTDNNPPDDDDQDGTIHATRSFTNLFAARVIDMVLPTNEIPFRIEPDEHPDPACVPTFEPPQPTADEQGNPVEPDEQTIVTALEAANDAAAGKMQDTVKDQVFEGGLNRHGRRMVKDAMRIGVGLLRCPFMQYKRRNKVSFAEGSPEPVVSVEKQTVPGMAYVNPHLFWYDMTPGLEKSRKTFEVELYDRAELMELKKYPNVIIGAVDELLAEKQPCVSGALGDTLSKRNRTMNLIEPLDGRWAVTRVYATIDPKKLQEIGGIEWPHDDAMPLIEMLMCNGKCITWKLSELECGYRVPYLAFTPFPCDDTIYGWSVPYMGRAAQASIDGAWTATKMNAAVSAGPHLFLRKGEFTPKDGAWRQLGPKIWDYTGTDGDIRSAMVSLMMQSNVEGNLELLEVAKENMSQDTMLAQILQGNVTEAAQGPAAGLVQLINLSTIIQRDIATSFDDGVAQPMAELYGQWNLLHNPDMGIKGDFNYKGITSTAHVAKDVQTQHLQVFTGMAQSPMFQGYADTYALFSANVEVLDFPGKENVVLPRDKALAAQAQMQQAQPDPLAEAKMAEIELGKQKAEADLAIRQQELELERQRMESDAQIKMAEINAKIQLAQMDLQRAYVEASSKREIDIAALDAQIDKATADNATKSSIEGAKIALQARKVAQDGERINLAATPSPDSALD